MTITKCRYCGSPISSVVSLGRIPLVNYFPSEKEIKKTKTYPLTLAQCSSCGLFQLDEIIPASEIFSSYHYVTGASEPLVKELSELAQYIIATRNLTKKSRVLDIGSNDGTLLSFFHKEKIQTIGVEPSPELSAYSLHRGIPTINAFFTKEVAKKILTKYGACDVVCATHVLANIIDLSEFMEGIRTVLSPTGVCVIEVANAAEMIANGHFDAIYHEHYSYFTIEMLDRLATDHGFTIVSTSTSSVQGGALRVELMHTSKDVKKVTYKTETPLNLEVFAHTVDTYKKQFLSQLAGYKGKKIIGFGAPAKGVTFTSFIGLNETHLGYIVDSTQQKQGRYLPATAIPIFPESYIADDSPDVVVVFSWNYRDAILSKLKNLTKKELIVIFPFPKLQVQKV